MAEIDCLGCSVDTKDINIEILHFKQFNKHFVFEKAEEAYVKKTQKKLHGCKSSFETSMMKQKNIINSFCTFYKSGVKSCSFLLFTKFIYTYTNIYKLI